MWLQEKTCFSSSLVVVLGIEPRTLVMLGKCSTPELHPSETHALPLTFGDQRRSQPTSQALSPGSGISVRMQMEDQREQSLDVVPYGSLLLRDPLLLSRAILAWISGKEEAKSSLS